MKKTFIAFSAFSCAIAAFAAAEAKASKDSCSEEPDYLLILGCTVHGEEPSETLKARINAAVEYLKSHPNVTAIPCGGIVQKDQTKAEARVIAEELVRAGIDPARIIPEDESKTTAQNFQNAKRIIEGLGATEKKAAFLSSEFHLLRASLIAKRAGMPMESIPANTPKKELLKAYLRELIVFPGAFLG